MKLMDKSLYKIVKYRELATPKTSAKIILIKSSHQEKTAGIKFKTKEIKKKSMGVFLMEGEGFFFPPRSLYVLDQHGFASILTHFNEVIFLNQKFELEFIMFYPKWPLGML